MLVWEHMGLQLGGTLSPAGDTGAGGEAEREDQALSGACSEAGGADPQGAQKCQRQGTWKCAMSWADRRC